MNVIIKQIGKWARHAFKVKLNVSYVCITAMNERHTHNCAQYIKPMQFV